MWAELRAQDRQVVLSGERRWPGESLAHTSGARRHTPPRRQGWQSLSLWAPPFLSCWDYHGRPEQWGALTVGPRPLGLWGDRRDQLRVDTNQGHGPGLSLAA